MMCANKSTESCNTAIAQHWSAVVANKWGQYLVDGTEIPNIYLGLDNVESYREIDNRGFMLPKFIYHHDLQYFQCENVKLLRIRCLRQDL